jgi:NAD(P)-dependent dehydrogenase (short-subunit alcohol dehydrogenase family)
MSDSVEQPETDRPRDGAHRLDGKVAIVTGGTQGVGEATARLFALRGAEGIVLTGRSPERGEAVADALRGLGAKASFVAADLQDPAAPSEICAHADEVFGRVDVLVNAAGNPDRDRILDTTPEFFDRMIAVNVRAPYFLIQGAARIMRREGIRGSIVTVGSITSHGGQPYLSTYAMSKGALWAMTKNVAYALLADGIRVNLLNPGWMDTPGEDATQRRWHGAEDGWQAEAGTKRASGRLMTADELARAIAFLASDESGLMTGALVDWDQKVIGAYD